MEAAVLHRIAVGDEPVAVPRVEPVEEGLWGGLAVLLHPLAPAVFGEENPRRLAWAGGHDPADVGADSEDVTHVEASDRRRCKVGPGVAAVDGAQDGRPAAGGPCDLAGYSAKPAEARARSGLEDLKPLVLCPQPEAVDFVLGHVVHTVRGGGLQRAPVERRVDAEGGEAIEVERVALVLLRKVAPFDAAAGP